MSFDELQNSPVTPEMSHDQDLPCSIEVDEHSSPGWRSRPAAVPEGEAHVGARRVEVPASSMSFRYLGNKTRIADWIITCIGESVACGARVADPMCGTAAVARALADRGYVVTAADELTFPVLHAKARLLPTTRCQFRPFAVDYAGAIRTLNAVPPLQGFFFREYSNEGTPQNGCKPRGYFTGENAARLDGMREVLRQWTVDGADAAAIDMLLHDLVLASNAYANIAGTYGYYRSSWSRKSQARLELTTSPVVESRLAHVVLQGKVERVAPSLNVDVCYLDPPYTKRQYAGNYHIPETLARQDEPTPVGDGGLRDWYPEYSKFCSRVHAAGALREVLRGLDVERVFLSYSEDGVIPEVVLRELLSEFGEVTRNEMPLQRFRSNGGGREGQVNEHLYAVRMR